MNPITKARCVVAGSLGLMAATSACAAPVQPQVTGFRSTERITHLAPGGANAAREMEVSVGLFDSAGKPLSLPGISVLVEAYEGNGTSGASNVGRTSVTTDYSGRAQVRLPLGTCKGSNIVGPVRVHRISNRPEYWDVTYAPAYIQLTAAGASARARFVHVCKETYRGKRP
jgi:hypothetical protein